jgi:tetratricopeptide (TPR) repeat protein
MAELSIAARCGAGTLSRVGHLNVLTLEGSPFEIGLQHGTLLKAEIVRGCAPTFGGDRAFADILSVLPDSQCCLVRQVIDGLYAQLAAGLDRDLNAELEGIARGADLPFDVVMRATCRSEILQVLAALEAAEPSGECTGLVVHGSRSEDGRLLHGKNQDYDGAGLWDAVPTVTVVRMPGALPHVRVGTAGLLKASFGINAAGIAVSGHILFSRLGTPAGIGFTALEHALLRTTDSLASAGGLLRRSPRWGAFAFMVSDGGRDEAAVFECDSEGVFARSATEGLLGCANHFMAAPDCARRDLTLAAGEARNSLARFRRLQDAAVVSSWTPTKVADILADRLDPCCGGHRTLGQTIASALTVMSAVADPVGRRIWVSNASVPTGDGPYIGFDLEDAFRGGEIRTLAPITPSPRHADGRDAMAAALAARRALDEQPADEGDRAQRALELAIDADPQDAGLRRLYARLLLRKGRFAAALDALLMPLEMLQSHGERAEAAYLSAIAHDCLGRRGEAVAALGEIVGAGLDDDPLRRIKPTLRTRAMHHLAVPFNPEDARALPLTFTPISGLA